MRIYLKGILPEIPMRVNTRMPAMPTLRALHALGGAKFAPGPSPRLRQIIHPLILSAVIAPKAQG